MGSERQIAANRRNAQNSTGPRSAAGKRRAIRNSYRHGLTSATASNAKLLAGFFDAKRTFVLPWPGEKYQVRRVLQHPAVRRVLRAVIRI